MKETPIIFSGESVRAILAGTKTQTRRVIKPGHPGGVIAGPAAHANMAIEAWGGGAWNVASRMEARGYVFPGDKLWVRESWRIADDTAEQVYAESPASIHYRADEDECSGGPWRSPIHMPRWASRLTLEVADVRVQRIQEISANDMLAEGVAPSCDDWQCTCWRDNYRQAWDALNGKRAPWESNPWVWAITFRRAAAPPEPPG